MSGLLLRSGLLRRSSMIHAWQAAVYLVQSVNLSDRQGSQILYLSGPLAANNASAARAAGRAIFLQIVANIHAPTIQGATAP